MAASQGPGEPSRPAMVVRALTAGGPPVVAAIVFLLAWPTLMPGVGFWDTAEFQAVPPLLGTLHPTGFPAYTILGWFASVVLQPLGSPAFRMNVLSALCVAAAAGLEVVLVRQLTGRSIIAIAAGLVLFLTEITWKIATHADAHALHLLLFALVLVLLVGWESRVRAEGGPTATADRWLVGAAAAYGVAVANHSLALLAGPGIVLFVFVVEPLTFTRPGLVARCVGTTVSVVALLYLELPLRAGPFRAPIVYGHPETLAGFVYVALGQQFGGQLASPLHDLGSRLADLVDFAAAQLGLLAALVPLAAIAVVLRRWRYVALTGPTLVITCLFAASYDNAEISRYYLGPLLIVVSWLAILADGLVGVVAQVIASGPARPSVRAPDRPSVRASTRTSALSSTGLLAIEAVLALALVAPAGLAAGATRQTVDESRATSAQGWLDETLARLEPNAVVVSWWSFSTPLWYARDVEGRRTDVTIIDDRTILDQGLGDAAHVIDTYLGKRPVYVIRQQGDMVRLAERYELLPLSDAIDSGLAQVIGLRTVAP